MKILGGQRIKNVLLAGISWFGHFRKSVDKINVFPVPDGDTGKNMHYAFQAAQKEIEYIAGKSVSEVAWAAARGALMGGRGCSGIILSGFFSGFAEGVGDRRTLAAYDLALAFQVGCLRARERVDYPVEGTILSVGEAAARNALQTAKKTQDLIEVMVSAWKGAKKALEMTPRQLKILKENQVVDAGGQGLVYFLEGMVRFNLRQSLSSEAALDLMPVVPDHFPLRVKVKSPDKYCTEFIIQIRDRSHKDLQAVMQSWGQELMLAPIGNGVYKVHLHTKDPEAVLKAAAQLGEISWKKVDDMQKQHQHAFHAD